MISKGSLVRFVGSNNRVRPIPCDTVFLTISDPYYRWLEHVGEASWPTMVDILVESEKLTLFIGELEKIE